MSSPRGRPEGELSPLGGAANAVSGGPTIKPAAGPPQGGLGPLGGPRAARGGSGGPRNTAASVRARLLNVAAFFRACGVVGARGAPTPPDTPSGWRPEEYSDRLISPSSRDFTPSVNVRPACVPGFSLGGARAATGPTAFLTRPEGPKDSAKVLIV